MEKRIKTLYIVTILAILGFLSMQVYWLYSRYVYSLSQYEAIALKNITEILDSYRKERIEILDRLGATFMPSTSYSVTRIPCGGSGDKDFKVTRTRVSAPGYAQKVLGIRENRPLTEAEALKVADIIISNDSLQEALQTEIMLCNPPSESAILDALKNYDLEMHVPFSTSKVDSILRAQGYDVEVSSIKTDSIEWIPAIQRHATAFSPTIQFKAPYSEMDNLSVSIIVHIPSFQVIKSMAGTLLIAFGVSILLIACLIYQFSTIICLDKLDRMRREFTSTMIHELKRPVSTLKMCVSGLANEKMNADPEIRSKLMTQTRKALDLLSAYFSEMRDLTFNKARQIPLNCERLLLHRIFNESEERIPRPFGKKVELSNDIPVDMVLYADRTHFTNIFVNIVENAIKYSGDSVHISAEAEFLGSGVVRIVIRDNGNGIPASDIHRIFSLFYRGNARNTGISGMGLGLSYVKMLVEAHGGTIAVSSRTAGPDKGTSFTIEIPQ